jgi:hypothetical protein
MVERGSDERDRNEEAEMSRLKSRRPSAGTVLGTLALIVALAGGTFAIASPRVIVRKGDIAKGAVTAKTLAPGAVHAKALAKGAVSPTALKNGSVNGAALAPNAVTAGALAPGSVYGGALGGVTVHSAAIADIDVVAENGTWTVSDSVTALCGAGERLLSGGVVFANPGNKEVAVISSVPFVNGTQNGWVGRITTNSGGSAAAEVQAFCLK